MFQGRLGIWLAKTYNATETTDIQAARVTLKMFDGWVNEFLICMILVITDLLDGNFFLIDPTYAISNV